MASEVSLLTSTLECLLAHATSLTFSSPFPLIPAAQALNARRKPSCAPSSQQAVPLCLDATGPVKSSKSLCSRRGVQQLHASPSLRPAQHRIFT